MKKVVMANDHGAVELKEEVKTYLTEKGFEVTDLGVAEEEAADYPDKAEEACREYLTGDYDFGILFCGTGIGISISANKVNGIRCALPQNKFAAQMAAEHNNANFIAFGGRIDYPEPVTEMVQIYIDTAFGGDRHERRVKKIMALES